MIYTLALNPALDYIIRTQNLVKGMVNRATSEKLFYGGKGINTSVVLTNLGIENIALGFVGGNIGKEFEKLLNNDGVKTNFVHVKNGNTRINVKIKDNEETDINAGGPQINKDEINELFHKIEKIQSGDFLTLAGSIPYSLPNDIYIKITKRLKSKDVKIVLDAEKNLLTDILPYKPFLIKPNHYELGKIFNKEFKSKSEIISAAKELQLQGARNVFVSMADAGGILITEEKKSYFSPAPRGNVINSTGAGDSLVAGFLAKYISSGDYKQAFAYGICSGSASAFSENLAKKEEIEKLFHEFSFDKIETLL